MNHVSDIRPILHSIMSPDGAPQDRARRVAETLNEMLEAGEFARLTSRQLVALRGVVWAVSEIADDVEMAQQQRQPQRSVRWWRR
jgi:hypothetical protein